MSFEWIHENPPCWDETKQRIVGGVPAGIFAAARRENGEMLPGEWWRAEQDGEVVGYGWMDCIWGDAEVLLAVDPDRRSHGAGTFILDRLAAEASSRGLNYLYNVVRPTHPDRAGITSWLNKRGFTRSHDEETLRRAAPAR